MAEELELVPFEALATDVLTVSLAASSLDEAFDRARPIAEAYFGDAVSEADTSTAAAPVMTNDGAVHTFEVTIIYTLGG